MTNRWQDYFKGTALIPIAGLLIYAGILLWVGLFHFEPWRDLAHVWVTVRDGSWWDVFSTIPAHSHPFLWFLLVKVLYTLGFPYQSTVILNILFCIAAGGLLVFRSPLPFWLKLIFLFTFPMLYEFALPGRIYAMGTFLVFLVCSLFPYRQTKTLWFCVAIALTFHTHSLFIALSAPVLLYFIYESFLSKKIWTKTYLIGWAIIGISGIYFLWYLKEVGAYNGMLNLSRTKNSILDIFDLGFVVAKGPYTILTLFTLLFLIATLAGSIQTIFLSMVALGLMVYAYQNVLPDFIRYYQILPVIVIALLWLHQYIVPDKEPTPTKPYKPEDKKNKLKKNNGPAPASFKLKPWITTIGHGLFSICLLISCKAGYDAFKKEIAQSHSDARSAAEYLVKNNLLDKEIIGHRSYTASAIVPYLPEDKKIWYADRQEHGTYIKFDSTFYLKNLSVNYPTALQNAITHFKGTQNLCLLFSIPLPQEASNDWRLVYQTTKEQIQRDEVYFIYLPR